jgi:lysozyme family protein
MADFGRAVLRVLHAEQGYVNDPDDYGGETKYGISKKQYPALDIKTLTVDQAKNIYKRDYWDKLSLDRLHDQAVAEEIFDTAVNMGWRTAARFVQEAINLLTESDLAVDGALGERTIAAVNSCRYPGALLKVLNGLQLGTYIRIVRNDPSQKKFFRGWLNRVKFWEERT